MYCAHAYGLAIASELPLPELPSVDAVPDVNVYLCQLDDLISTKRDKNSWLLEHPAAGKFIVEDGKRIFVEPQKNAESGIVTAILLGAVMSAVLFQRGLFVLHASCVDIDNYAIAFLGASGCGKSTMAQLFHSRGRTILTDDVMAVKMKDTIPTAIPSYAQVRLLPDAAEALGYSFEELDPLYNLAPKRAHQVKDGFGQTPLPIKRLYLLARGTENAIEPLTPQVAFMGLVQNSRVSTYLSDSDSLSHHFTLCEQFALQVPMRILKRKGSLSDLPYLADLVEADVVNT